MSTVRKALIEQAIVDQDRHASKRQKEAAKNYFAALKGDRKAMEWLVEGISTSDIPALLTPAINVQFLAQYADQPIVWNQIAEEYTADTLGTVEFGSFDFDTSDLPDVSDGDAYVGAGLPGVPEYGEYPAVKFTTEALEAELRKNGVRFRFSWEAQMKARNFDMIGLSTAKFARYAAEQEDITLAKQFVNTAGTINAAFTDLAGNTALSLASLQAAKAAARNVTVDGRRVTARDYALVVGSALVETAQDILSIREVERTSGSDVFNIAPRNGDVSVVDFWALEQVGGAVTPGATDDYWFLVPRNGARAAFLEVFLSGYRVPSVTVKDSGHFSIGGGAVPERDGRFEDDSVETRGRHVVQATALTPSIVIASNGSGV